MFLTKDILSRASVSENSRARVIGIYLKFDCCDTVVHIHMTSVVNQDIISWCNILSVNS
jgi:hypothetical protein